MMQSKETTKDESLYGATSSVIGQISNDLYSSYSKAALAKLRQSLGTSPTKTIEIFPLVLANLPEKYLGKGDRLTYGEKSILITLQLYALHQQGKQESVNIQDDTEAGKVGKNLGAALASLRTDESTAIDRRFNAMITATDLDELAVHLRHLIKLLKARTDTKVNYPKLSEDLYWYQLGQENEIRLKWARSYYRQNHHHKGENTND